MFVWHREYSKISNYNVWIILKQCIRIIKIAIFLSAEELVSNSVDLLIGCFLLSPDSIVINKSQWYEFTNGTQGAHFKRKESVYWTLTLNPFLWWQRG